MTADPKPQPGSPRRAPPRRSPTTPPGRPRAPAALEPQLAADLFVRCLESEGVEFVFGIPGEETLAVSEALDHSESHHLHPHPPRAGRGLHGRRVRAPDGQPGRVPRHARAGATNLATGIGDANLDKAPVVALTGQVRLAGMHKETHQFIDTVDMLAPMTKWNTRVHDPRMIGEAVRKAFSIAASEKPGATHLELPEDVMGSSVTGRPLPHTPVTMTEPDAAALQRAAHLIQTASRPLILAGNGVVRQGASQALRDFVAPDRAARHHDVHGQGSGRRRRRALPVHRRAACAELPKGVMGRADLIVTVGYDVVEWPPSSWNPDGTQRIVCIDTVPPEIDANFVSEVELIGDLGHTLKELGSLLWNKPAASWEAPPYRTAFRQVLEAGADDDSPVKPQRVLRDLRALMAPDDLLISDVGAHKLWVARLWEAHEPNTVLISNGFAAMGFALPAAVACALALRGRRKVVAVCGDGGFLMNVQELETARRLGLPFVVLVWSDGAFGLIEMHQRTKYKHVSGTRFDNPDLVALAHSFGIDGLRVQTAGELPAILKKALAARGPVIVDIPIDYSENDKLGIDLWKLAPEVWPSL